jgi:hypothetical protein
MWFDADTSAQSSHDSNSFGMKPEYQVDSHELGFLSKQNENNSLLDACSILDLGPGYSGDNIAASELGVSSPSYATSKQQFSDDESFTNYIESVLGPLLPDESVLYATLWNWDLD